MNLQSSFTYGNFGRRTSRTLQLNNTTIASAGRSYDTFDRIVSVSNGTDTLSYTYRPGGQLSLSGWTNGQNAAMSNQSYEYDQYNRLTGIKLNNVNEVSYTLNAKDQRTAATYANAGLWNFTYDDKGQVTGANGSSKSYAYSYDGIGNRLTANENSTVTNYTSNLLNQYTLINNTAPGVKINHCVFRCGLWSKPICPAGQDKSITSPDEYDIHGNREDCHLMHDHGIFRAKGFLQEAYQRYPTNLADLCRTLPYACSLF